MVPLLHVTTLCPPPIIHWRFFFSCFFLSHFSWPHFFLVSFSSTGFWFGGTLSLCSHFPGCSLTYILSLLALLFSLSFSSLTLSSSLGSFDYLFVDLLFFLSLSDFSLVDAVLAAKTYNFSPVPHFLCFIRITDV